MTIDDGGQQIQPFGFGDHPLADRLGQEVEEMDLQPYQYRTPDQQTLIDVLQDDHRGEAVGAAIRTLGSSRGATPAVRASVERLPMIRVAFTGPAPLAAYELAGGRAADGGGGDRAPGWGLGSHAFARAGSGIAHTDQMDGRRCAAEGGGGVTSGPFGVALSFKVVGTRFQTPGAHRLQMIPITLRATVSF